MVERVQHWERVHPRSRLQAPSTGKLGSQWSFPMAELLAVCRAVILEVPKATQQYLDIVDYLNDQPWLSAFLKPSRSRTEAMVRTQMWRGGMGNRYLETTWPNAQKCADDWLYGSQTGAGMMAVIGLFYTIGISMESAENMRAFSETFTTFYQSRTEDRVLLRKLAKLRGWKQLDDARLMREARLWANAHHVYASLVRAVEAMYTDDWECGADRPKYADWSRRLRKFDVVVGRKRTRGAWS